MIISRGLKVIFHFSKPDKLNLGDNSQFLRFGIGIRVMDYFWITGGSIYGSFLGNFIRGARYITDFHGQFIFCTIFHEDFKNIFFFQYWTHLINEQALPTKPVAELVRGLCGQKLCVNWVCSILKKIIFLESSWKIVQNINRPSKSVM